MAALSTYIHLEEECHKTVAKRLLRSEELVEERFHISIKYLLELSMKKIRFDTNGVL